jgi:hypothetical protein
MTALIHKVEGLPTLLAMLEYRLFVPLPEPTRNVFLSFTLSVHL